MKTTSQQRGALIRSADVAFTPTSPVRANRGCARFRHGGELREVVHDLDQSLAIEPVQPLAFLQKGKALLEMRVRESMNIYASDRWIYSSATSPSAVSRQPAAKIVLEGLDLLCLCRVG